MVAKININKPCPATLRHRQPPTQKRFHQDGSPLVKTRKEKRSVDDTEPYPAVLQPFKALLDNALKKKNEITP